MKVPVSERIITPEQKKAIEHGDGPLMIIAGAGSGKTTVITERIKYLIEKEYAKANQILALTFTEKASKEMIDRIDQIVSYKSNDIWVFTFHGFCDRILRQEGIHIGLNPEYALLSDASSIQFFQNMLFRLPLSYFRPLGNPNKFIRGLLQHFSRIHDEDITPTDYLHWVEKMRRKKIFEKDELEKLQELSNCFNAYEMEKKSHDKLDYGNLISECLRLFRTRPHILHKYQQQFKYILIDEFQDTNVSQNELAILLMNKSKNITVVGDDDQAIYRFRGAATSNMIQFRQRFPKTAVVVLTENFRSTQEILNRSYDLINNNNPDRLEVTEKINKKLISARRIVGDPISFLYADTVEDEAEGVVKEILAYRKNHEDVQFGDFAILVRANAHAEPFIRALARNRLPYQFLGPSQLLRNDEVKDIVAYLQFLTTLDDSVAFYRVISMDVFGIDPRDIAMLLTLAKKSGMSLFEFIESLVSPDATGAEKEILLRIKEHKTIEVLTRIISMVQRHLSLIKKESGGQIAYYFLKDSGLLSQLSDADSQKDIDKATHIAKFFAKIKSYETEHEDISLFMLVSWLKLTMELGESTVASESDWTLNDAVNIVTVHSAKGLEFPVVFVVNLVTERFPSRERNEQLPIPELLIKDLLPKGDAHIQEERRLFYVAMTRARDALYFSAAKYYGMGRKEKKISPFVFEALGDTIANNPTATLGQTTQLYLGDWASVASPAEAVKKNTITYLSYSQIESFELCPLQYKFRSILKIPIPESGALLLGSAVHAVLFDYYSRILLGSRVTKKVLHQSLDTHWVHHALGSILYEEKLKKKAVEIIDNYFALHNKDTVQPRYLEESFKLKIADDLFIGGKIDRIDQTADGLYEIIDYKTGASTKKKNPETDLQLTIYAMAVSKKETYDIDLAHVVVSFYFLEDQTKKSAIRTQKQLDQAKEKILRVRDAIEVSSFEPTAGNHCDFCEFKLLCPAWK